MNATDIDQRVATILWDGTPLELRPGLIEIDTRKRPTYEAVLRALFTVPGINPEWVAGVERHLAGETDCTPAVLMFLPSEYE